VETKGDGDRVDDAGRDWNGSREPDKGTGDWLNMCSKHSRKTSGSRRTIGIQSRQTDRRRKETERKRREKILRYLKS